MSERIQDETIALLHRVLGRTSVRATVTASNLANVETPGFRALRAEFHEELDQANVLPLAGSDPRHLSDPASPVRADLVEAPATRARVDGNTVDLDREMTRLATLQGRYITATRLVRKRFALLRYAANDGKA